MTKNFIIAILVALLIWFGTAPVRVENERYALLLDMCPHNAPLLVPDCRGVETRTSWIWHLVYGWPPLPQTAAVGRHDGRHGR